MRGLLLLAEQLVHGADKLVAESLRFSETKAIRVAYDRRDGARRQLREGWRGAIATWFVRAVGVFLRCWGQTSTAWRGLASPLRWPPPPPTTRTRPKNGAPARAPPPTPPGRPVLSPPARPARPTRELDFRPVHSPLPSELARLGAGRCGTPWYGRDAAGLRRCEAAIPTMATTMAVF